MAPIFNESVKSRGYPGTIPRKMFQRPLEQVADSLDDLREPGDFALSPNPELTQELLMKFTSSPASTDLANVCLTWFTKYPKPLPPLSMMNDLGEIYPLKPKGPNITGAW